MSMNQGKLQVVKQEMARVNIDILGISEQKWTGMGEFNSDDHYIYYCGQESFTGNGVALIVNRRVQNPILGFMRPQKWKNDLSSFPRQTIQYHSNPSLCPTTNAKEAEVDQLHEDPQRTFRTDTEKIISFSL